MSFFIKKVTEPPTCTYNDWRDLVGPNFNWPNLWKLVRHKTAENKNNDLLWQIITRGVKVRALLKKWNHIQHDRCSLCRFSETIEHCFFECRRVRKVWTFFQPLLSKLSPSALNFKTVIFPTGSASNQKTILFSFVVKTILYSIWTFRNRATFHLCKVPYKTIITDAENEIRFRLQHEFAHLRRSPFIKLWAFENCLCEVKDDRLLLHV